ncbi:hypothetical protein NIES806_35060 [Dolichospermum compactum NIES-806]|uniref:Uncharacterized protein n=1 Tax=Dolichospermum compactum NIES-806 TaxID=1973481 RepID=A0A1Z4V762_9CYAN|nr:hypothetical protein NIES806_35060 [Dolichospermum compactum NIES-806]
MYQKCHKSPSFNIAKATYKQVLMSIVSTSSAFLILTLPAIINSPIRTNFLIFPIPYSLFPIPYIGKRLISLLQPITTIAEPFSKRLVGSGLMINLPS